MVLIHKWSFSKVRIQLAVSCCAKLRTCLIARVKIFCSVALNELKLP